jgi:hypothetical protein
LDSLPAACFDLYLHIDDGLRYLLPERLHPCAWWVIDTHRSYDWNLQARAFDGVFAAQKDPGVIESLGFSGRGVLV